MKRPVLSGAGLKEFLDAKFYQYNRPGFIENDPVSIPHHYKRRQDIEIAALFAAVLAWGKRTIIINKCRELIKKMDNSPYDFIMNHSRGDRNSLKNFKHRTFQPADAIYFVKFLQSWYREHDSLEPLFFSGTDQTIEAGLKRFHREFFSLRGCPLRTRKHIPTPERRSACKRINMFLRWMVRSDDHGVDFGIWRTISSAQLICPVDVHVGRVAKRLRLIGNSPLNWQTALELTDKLKQFDPADPVKYDFALFGLGVEEGF